jgi:hypothetical protein
MNRNTVFCTAVLIAAFAATAFAGEGKEARLSETISLWGGSSPVLDYLTGTKDVVGARYQLHVPMGQGHHWTASPGFGYGYGHWKVDQTSPSYSPATYELTESVWEATLDFLHHSDCCSDIGFYGGPGLFYSSLSLKDEETGSPDITYDPCRTFGVQLTVGGGIPVSQKLELTGSMTQRAGLSSFHRKDVGFFSSDNKYSGITCSTQFGCGLRIRF